MYSAISCFVTDLEYFCRGSLCVLSKIELNSVRFVVIILSKSSSSSSTSFIKSVASLSSVSEVSNFINLKLSSLNNRQLFPKNSSENMDKLTKYSIIFGNFFDNVLLSLSILSKPLVKNLALKLSAESCSSLLSSNNITNIE